ncbi:MAG: RDD family protein [Tenericutes bacterium ADurb.Bin087]|nr:MAG: RDD family protein [Tenericutes bacterium ADurb.Bin087]
MNHYVVKQTMGKRFLAGLLDTIIVIVVALFIYIPAQIIAEKNGLNQALGDIYILTIKSGLYDLKGDIIKDDELYPKALYTFYVDQNIETGEYERGYSALLVEGHEYNTAEDYYTVILGKGKEDTLFTFATIDEEAPWAVPIKSGQEEAAKQFYRTEIEKAHQHLDYHPAAIALIKKVETILFITIGSSYLISAFLMIVIVPNFRKDKVTLGKVITGTIVLNRLGYKMSVLQANMRNFAIFIFSFGFFFVPFHLISFILAFFSKTKRSMYDHLAATLVADKKATLVFNDVNEETKYRKELAQRLIAVDKRKAESREERLKEKEMLNLND